jgi:hypothetical protein
MNENSTASSSQWQAAQDESRRASAPAATETGVQSFDPADPDAMLDALLGVAARVSDLERRERATATAEDVAALRSDADAWRQRAAEWRDRSGGTPTAHDEFRARQYEEKADLLDRVVGRLEGVSAPGPNQSDDYRHGYEIGYRVAIIECRRLFETLRRAVDEDRGKLILREMLGEMLEEVTE